MSIYDEMIKAVKEIDNELHLSGRQIFLFGHCGATLELIDLLDEMGYTPTAILDNSKDKQGLEYKGAQVIYPHEIKCFNSVASITDGASNIGTVPSDRTAFSDDMDKSIVLITSRFYASMLRQLREMGYDGPVRKVINHNTYAEYSLSDDTVKRMTARENHGEDLLRELTKKHSGCFKVFFPFNALGDVYFAMSYWKAFAKARGVNDVVFSVSSVSLKRVINLFGDYPVEIYEQKELDAMIQAVIYTKDENAFIAHQDRPYVVNLHRALYIKKIPLEQVYCCGVYGLPKETEKSVPMRWSDSDITDEIEEANTVILSPYAKSVIALSEKIWLDIIDDYRSKGYTLYTNVSGDEEALPGTKPLTVQLDEMKSVLEKAGTFIGIRSGLCDVIRTAGCKKIALYPDYKYCDTKWKSIEMYAIDGFENIEVKDGDTWEAIKVRIFQMN